MSLAGAHIKREDATVRKENVNGPTRARVRTAN